MRQNIPCAGERFVLHQSSFSVVAMMFLAQPWVYDPQYDLATPWWHTSHVNDESIREDLMRTAPKPFARRNIFCSNRLYQNKYELKTWIQEARDQGMTGPAEIWGYVRQKEVSIHGG